MRARTIQNCEHKDIAGKRGGEKRFDGKRVAVRKMAYHTEISAGLLTFPRQTFYGMRNFKGGCFCLFLRACWLWSLVGRLQFGNDVAASFLACLPPTSFSGQNCDGQTKDVCLLSGLILRLDNNINNTDEQSQPQTDLLPRVGLGSSINWTSLILFVCVFVAQSVIEILGNALISLNRYS